MKFLILLTTLLSITIILKANHSSVAINDTSIIKILIADQPEAIKELVKREEKKKTLAEEYGASIVTIVVFFLGFLKISHESKKNTERILYAKKLEDASIFLDTLSEFISTIDFHNNLDQFLQIKDSEFSDLQKKLKSKLTLVLNEDIEADKQLLIQINSIHQIENFDELRNKIESIQSFGKLVYKNKSI